MDYLTPQRKARLGIRNMPLRTLADGIVAGESVVCPLHGWKVIDGVLYVQSAAEQAEAA